MGRPKSRFAAEAMAATPARAQHVPSFSNPYPYLLYLAADKSPASLRTRWEELHPESQNLLLHIQKVIGEYIGECDLIEKCSRLFDVSVSVNEFELLAGRIVHELAAINMSMERGRVLAKELKEETRNIMRDTESAMRFYLMLRQRFIRQKASSVADGVISSQLLAAASSFQKPVYDFYYGVPRKPSSFMKHIVARYEEDLTECWEQIKELEQLIAMNKVKTTSSSGLEQLQALPSVLSDVHDFFVHVASKMETLHQNVETMKSAYLANRRRHGDRSDPFLEADRRETAKQEAAARKVHPTLYSPAISAQQSIHSACLFSNYIAGTCNNVPNTFRTPSPPASPAPLPNSAVSSIARNLFGSGDFDSPRSTRKTPPTSSASKPSPASPPVTGEGTAAYNADDESRPQSRPSRNTHRKRSSR